MDLSISALVSFGEASMNSPKNMTKIYWTVYLALLLLLVVTINAAMIDMGPFNLFVALTISILKTVLVVLYFMHVRQSGKLVGVVAAAGFFWIFLAALLLFTDYLTRGI